MFRNGREMSVRFLNYFVTSHFFFDILIFLSQKEDNLLLEFVSSFFHRVRIAAGWLYIYINAIFIGLLLHQCTQSYHRTFHVNVIVEMNYKAKLILQASTFASKQKPNMIHFEKQKKKQEKIPGQG